MAILTRTLRWISSYQTLVVPRLNISSNKRTPIKMAAQIFKTDETVLNKSPLMVMHGLLDSSHNLRNICEELEEKSRRTVYNLDARNHGDSPHISAHSSADMAEDIAYLMKEEGINRVAVMGHSMGGRTMMFFALTYPEMVEKAIIVDVSPISVPRKIGTMENIFVAIQNLSIPSKLSEEEGRAVAVRELLKSVTDKEVVKFIVLNLVKKSDGEFVWRPNVHGLGESIKHFRTSQFFNDMNPYKGPVLFIAGKESVFLNPKDWPKIKKLFPNAELKWLDGGHWIHFDQPVEFLKLVVDFLK